MAEHTAADPPAVQRATTVTQALDLVGLGRYQHLLLLYCGVAWAADACETMLLSYLGPSVACAWPADVGPAGESALTSVVFAGMLGGVYCLGAVADAFGRRRGFLASAVLLGAAGLASAAAPSFGWLLAARGVVGIALGGTPIAVTLFAEFAPSGSRGAWLLALQGFWTVGTMAEAGLAWAVLPKYGWRWLLALSATPLLALLLAFPWLPESPHWLAAQGRWDEAEAVLRALARVNGRAKQVRIELRRGPDGGGAHSSGDEDDEAAAPQAQLEPALPAGGRRAGAALRRPFRRAARVVGAGLRRVFSPELRGTTCLLWFIWAVNAVTYYGLVLLSTALQQSGRAQQCTGGAADFRAADFRAVLVTSAGEAPGLVAAALLVDRRGRKWTIRAGLLVCAAAVLALLGARAAAARLALLFAARAAIEATFSALYVYTPELYPTAVRSFGLALCNAFSRLGGFAAPFATVYLVERGRTGAAEGLLGVLCLAAAAAAFALRYETRGRDLQAERLEADGQAAAAAWRHGGGGGGGGGPGPATELEEARPLVR